MRVLLAVDGSECSESAVETVIDRFRPEAGHDISACRNQSFERARQLVDGVAGRLSLKGFDATVSTPDADPRHAIVDAARQWPADLIVLGSHGRRAFDRWLLGSVAESVARHAPCSVEIVRAPLAA